VNANDPLYNAIFGNVTQPTNIFRIKNNPLPPILRSILSTRNQGVKLSMGIPRSISIFRAKDEPDLIRRISSQVDKILRTKLTISEARVVPYIEDIAHIEEAKKVKTAVLHIDIRNSSNIVEELSLEIALKIYQIFHSCVTETVRYKGGSIRTFAGDRIVALFKPGNDNIPRTTAVDTALSIDKMLTSVVNVALKQNNIYPLVYGIGIDYGEMLAGRIGKNGKQNNDIVWAGRAMNYASKLADYGNGIYLSQAVYNRITDKLKNDVNNFWLEKKDLALGSFYQVTSIFQ